MFVAATNQAANFTAYQEMKKYARRLQNVEELPSYQHLILGGISGAMGNNNKEMGSTGAKNSKFIFFFFRSTLECSYRYHQDPYTKVQCSRWWMGTFQDCNHRHCPKRRCARFLQGLDAQTFASGARTSCDIHGLRKGPRMDRHVYSQIPGRRNDNSHWRDKISG